MSENPEIFILEAQQGHAKLLSELSRKTFFEAYASSNTPENMALYLNSNFFESTFAEQIANENDHFLIALGNLIPVGYAHLRREVDPKITANQNSVELVRFYVDQKWHGKGVAHLIMKECLRWSFKQGFNEIWLGVWEKNPRAQAFYKKWGFEQVGVHPFHFGDEIQVDYTFMRRLDSHGAELPITG